MDELPEHSKGKNALKQIHNIVVNYYLLDTKKIVYSRLVTRFYDR